MKHIHRKGLLFVLNLILLLCSCKQEIKVPIGYWKSVQGRPNIQIMKKGNGYAAIVYHKTYEGGCCPIEYPLVTSPSGMYIQAEGRILISSSREQDKEAILFLSPGGTYIKCGSGGAEAR